MRRALIATACSGILAAPVLAHAPELSRGFADCMERSGGVTAAMADCIGDEHRRQDQRLNAAFQKLLAGRGASWHARIKDAQRKWIAYRDAACGLHASTGGGTLDRIAVADCNLTMTEQRAGELESLGPEEPR